MKAPTCSSPRTTTWARTPARSRSLNLDEYLAGNPALEGYLPVAIDGSKVDGAFYMVPESLKAVALWYDKSAGADPADDVR